MAYIVLKIPLSYAPPRIRVTYNLFLPRVFNGYFVGGQNNPKNVNALL